jgi:hypothetical protein
VTVKLNRKGLSHARRLAEQGKVVRAGHDDWSEHAPSTDDENAFIDEHGYGAYGEWFLGVDDDMNEDTKGRYSFPYGDFTKVHRSGVIAAESRAAQNDHDDIATAAKNLLELIDKE